MPELAVELLCNQTFHGNNSMYICMVVYQAFPPPGCTHTIIVDWLRMAEVVYMLWG